MRAVIQKVSECRVSVDGKIIAESGPGLLVYLGVARTDTREDLEYIVRKTCNLRIFEDSNGKMNLSFLDKGSMEIMVISQFTLYGDARKGKRPSFSNAAGPDKGEELYLQFIEACKNVSIPTKHGSFGSKMDVSYTNEGPITILIDSDKMF